MAQDSSHTVLVRCAHSRILRKCFEVYLSGSSRIWNHSPASMRRHPLGQAYGRHLNAIVHLQAERAQNYSTYFLRNRAELELMRRLLDQKAYGSTLDITVLACSKGAEVYSIVWTIRSARPDLKLRMHAVDVSEEVLEFAERGVYSRTQPDVLKAPNLAGIKNRNRDGETWKFWIFERMTDEEVKAMFEVEGDQATVRTWLKAGITWLRWDAGDPALIDVLGPQDIVVANRFLCHMRPPAALKCLRNVARLVAPGGHLFVSGVDLEVRIQVAREMGWKPVTDLIREIHEGDPSLTSGWPFGWWGLEPFSDDRPDWKIRYASVFQIGEAS